MSRVRPAVRCRARRTNGEPCANYAMMGATVCHAHGGRAPQVRAKAVERVTEARAVVLLASHQVAPVADPMEALRHLAGEVLAWRDILRAMVGSLESLARTDYAGREQARAVVVLYERALDRAGRILLGLTTLTLDDRLVMLSERQADLIEGVIDRAIDRAGLPEEWRPPLYAAIAAELRAADRVRRSDDSGQSLDSSP